MRKLSTVLMAIVLAALVLSCGGGTATQAAASGGGAFQGAAGETYYMVAFLSGHPFWVGCRLGAEAAASQLGVTLRYGGDPEYDVNKSVQAFEQIVATGPKGVLLTCIDPNALKEPIDNAVNAGVPVITFDTDSPDSKRLSFVSTDNSFLGGFLYDYMSTNLFPSGNATIGVIGRTNQLNIRQRMDGFAAQAAARRDSGVTVLPFVDDQGEITVATSAMAAQLQAHPEITIIFAADGQGATGSVQACKEAGRTDIKIMTVDSDQGILDLIKAGDLYGTVAQNTFNMGYWAMMQMYAYTHNLVDPFNNWEAEKISPMPPYINSGVDIVTKDNTDAFVVPTN
ncbi:MAG: substrate-binding domain-containing protein [Treponema sp.]|jgi:ribose transport system substrate-binding protein|nr:substrate-binding domain-containing protein [Treponema sp.]